MSIKPRVTKEEKQKYEETCQLLKEHKITPSPLEAWIVRYRTAQVRIKRAEEASKGKEAKNANRQKASSAKQS